MDMDIVKNVRDLSLNEDEQFFAELITEADLKDNWAEELDNLQLNGISWLYHFSPKCNLTSILTRGLMSRAYALTCGIHISQYGGNQISHDQSNSFGYADFIHLCFCQDHPMMLRVAQDTKQNLVLFAIDPIVIAFNGTQLTDQNAASNDHQPISSLGSMPSEVIAATKQRIPYRRLHGSQILCYSCKYIFCAICCW